MGNASLNGSASLDGVDEARVSQPRLPYSPYLPYLPYIPTIQISAEIGSLESLRSLGSLGRALSSFICKAQPLPKFTILPNFTIFSLCFALPPSLSTTT